MRTALGVHGSPTLTVTARGRRDQATTPSEDHRDQCSAPRPRTIPSATRGHRRFGRRLYPHGRDAGACSPSTCPSGPTVRYDWRAHDLPGGLHRRRSGVPGHTVINRHVSESLAPVSPSACGTLYGSRPAPMPRRGTGSGGRAREAVEPDPRAQGVPSTKGVLSRTFLAEKENLRLGLRFGKPPIGPARWAGRRRRHGDRRPVRRTGADGLDGAGRRRVRSPCMDRARRHRRRRDHRRTGRRGGVRAGCVRRDADPVRSRGVEFGVDSRGCGQWPGSVTRLERAGDPRNRLERRRRGPGSPALRGSGPGHQVLLSATAPRRRGRATDARC